MAADVKKSLWRLERSTTMQRLSRLSKSLLIGLLALFISLSQPIPVSAGFNTWSSIGPEGGWIYALAINPTTPSTLYAGTDGGAFKSTDGGATWSAVNTGLSDPDVYALAINPTAPNTLYAGANGGVFKSTDGGANWSASLSGVSGLRSCT
jgi:BNR/Asp-box repeat.